MNFSETSEFKKEFKKYQKKFHSLGNDLRKLKKILTKFPCGNGSKHWNVLTRRKNITILKVRLSCSYLKKNSFRIIYVYNKQSQELELIEFIEIYFKSDKPREDKERIKKYLNNP